MPYPTEGESQGAYVSRFMGSPEANSSFPNKKQRAAVAYSMYKQHRLAHAVRHAPRAVTASGASVGGS
jgi:hypothetical protein